MIMRTSLVRRVGQFPHSSGCGIAFVVPKVTELPGTFGLAESGATCEPAGMTTHRAPRQPTARLTSVSRVALLVLLSFGAVSSFAGGCLGVFTDGGGIPLTYLTGTPFQSYLIPGLILGILVGGTQLLGAVTVQLGRPRGMLAAAVAGFGMMMWIFIELAMLREYSFLQSIYFALGAAELALVLVALGLLSPARRRSTQPEPALR